MTLTLTPETERLIDAEVRSGRYPTAKAVVAAALAALAERPVWDETPDEEDLAAIAEADAEAERGEVVDLESARAEVAH